MRLCSRDLGHNNVIHICTVTNNLGVGDRVVMYNSLVLYGLTRL